MADATDILVNVGGWIVAGLVTLAGVWAAHRFEEHARERRDALRDIFRPLHEELSRVLGSRDRAKFGVTIWTEKGETYLRIKSSGALVPDRYANLRRDLADLDRLDVEQNAASGLLGKAVTDGLGDVWESLAKRIPKGLGHPNLQKISIANDTGLDNAIRGQDESQFEEWLRKLLVQFEGEATGPSISTAGLYRVGCAKIQAPRADYDQATDRFIAWASRVQRGIEEEIGRTGPI